jgi:hypothetical protein
MNPKSPEGDLIALLCLLTLEEPAGDEQCFHSGAEVINSVSGVLYLIKNFYLDESIKGQQ